jgi:hypothetical protein
MSTLAIVLIVVGVILLLFFIGGLVVARRRLEDPDYYRHLEEAERELEHARATDRGWDRDLLHAAARAALESEHPGKAWPSLELFLVEDRPGVEEDRAHMMARGPEGRVRVVLKRRPDGEWVHERVE